MYQANINGLKINIVLITQFWLIVYREVNLRMYHQ